MEKHESGDEPRTERESYYEVLLSGQADSGLSVAAFAAQVGVSAATLYSWKRRLGRADQGDDGSALVGTLVEVCVHDEGHAEEASGGMILAMAGGVRVELGADFDTSALERLLGVLDRC